MLPGEGVGQAAAGRDGRLGHRPGDVAERAVAGGQQTGIQATCHCQERARDRVTGGRQSGTRTGRGSSTGSGRWAADWYTSWERAWDRQWQVGAGWPNSENKIGIPAYKYMVQVASVYRISIKR